jgi:hypothetical protein
MFASLRNKFSNYRTCTLRFDIEENIIIEAFASLRSITLTFAFNVFERVYTIEACASGRFCTTEVCVLSTGTSAMSAYLLSTPRITDPRSR